MQQNGRFKYFNSVIKYEDGEVMILPRFKTLVYHFGYFLTLIGIAPPCKVKMIFFFNIIESKPIHHKIEYLQFHIAF
ncbi:MAG: hypothetical protein RLZZ172_1865 [Bacteroidota bacterium]|jgi:hypothetical protein